MFTEEQIAIIRYCADEVGRQRAEPDKVACLVREVIKAQAWITANPARAPRKDVAAFLYRWFAKASGE